MYTQLQLLCMGSGTVGAAAACWCNATQAAVHLGQLAVACVILQPYMLPLASYQLVHVDLSCGKRSDPHELLSCCIAGILLVKVACKLK